MTRNPSGGIAIPVAIVLLSLVTLAVVPAVVQRRVDLLRDQITEVADPASNQLGHIKLQLGVEAAARRGFLLSGDTVLAGRARRARVARMIAQDSARHLLDQLDAGLASRADTLDRQLLVADAEIDSLFQLAGAAPAYSTGLADREQRTDIARVTVDSIAAELARATASRRTAIQRAERVGQWASMAIVLISLIAALAVVRIARRYRLLATELDTALGDAERARDASEERQREITKVTESRTRLIRGFTHDVKNPLGAADGYLALMEDGVIGTLDPAQRDTVARVRRSIHTALTLIGQLLDLARAEAGQLDLQRLPTQVEELAREIAEEYRAQAEAKRQELHLAVAGEVPSIVSDPLRVAQIIANLVSNAVKYTPAGGRIALAIHHADAWVVLTVEDDGAGIPADRLPLLFEEFTRFDPGAAKGSGIGLAISRRVARMLGGDIAVDSVVGRGSRFTLTLPSDLAV